jgi:hypothetical protein
MCVRACVQYYHFAFRLPRWLRPAITGIQIVQLVTVRAPWAAEAYPSRLALE